MGKMWLCKAPRTVRCRHKRQHEQLPGVLVCAWEPLQGKECRDRKQITLEVK